MNRTICRLAAAQLHASALLGCASAPPEFPTSDRAPREAVDSVLDDTTERRIQGPWEAAAEETVREMLVALSTHDVLRARALLSTDARVQRGASGPQKPLTTLLSGDTNSTGNLTSAVSPPFGSATFVSIQTTPSRTHTLVTLRLDSPPNIAGLWRIRLRRSKGRLEVIEVQLPPSK